MLLQRNIYFGSNCWWCSNRNQSIKHLIFECKGWNKERKELLHQLAKKGLSKPRKEGKKAVQTLFQEPKAIEAILAFIANTGIGIRPQEKEREEERIDLYGIEDLD